MVNRSVRKLSNKCIRPKGFSMISHCKAIGKLKRTGKKNKGNNLEILFFKFNRGIS